MPGPHTIETAHLILRPFQPDDATPLYEIQGDADAMRFTYRAHSLEECAMRLQTYEETRKQLGFAPWVVVHRGDAHVIGWGGLNVDPFDPGWGVEVSYFLRPAYWGRGFATELVQISLHYAFENMSLPRVAALAMPANIGSIRVLEKCGFVFLRYEPRLKRNHYFIERMCWAASRVP